MNVATNNDESGELTEFGKNRTLRKNERDGHHLAPTTIGYE